MKEKALDTPMQVLVLGLCRTGTQSLADALEILLHTPIYHMREVGKNQHADRWVQALEAKFDGIGKPYGRAEFDELFSGFAGVSDIPAAIFAEELITAYPDAKIILSLRDVDRWCDSMKRTVCSPGMLELGGPQQGLRRRYHHDLWRSDFAKNGVECFEKHNEMVRRAAPTGNMLEWEAKDGWGPLCEFLGLEVPAVEFPWSDAAPTTTKPSAAGQ